MASRKGWEGGLQWSVKCWRIVTAQVPEPSVDPPHTRRVLAESLFADGQLPGPDAWPLLSWSPATAPGDQYVRRSLAPARAGQTAASLSRKNFIANAQVPRSSQRAHLGGRLKPRPRDVSGRSRKIGTRHRLRDRAHRSGSDVDICGLVAADARTLLNQIARQLGISNEGRLQGPTRLAPTRLTEVAPDTGRRRDDVARYLAAIEQTDGTREAHRRLPPRDQSPCSRGTVPRGHDPRRPRATSATRRGNGQATPPFLRVPRQLGTLAGPPSDRQPHDGCNLNGGGSAHRSASQP